MSVYRPSLQRRHLWTGALLLVGGLGMVTTVFAAPQKWWQGRCQKCGYQSAKQQSSIKPEDYECLQNVNKNDPTKDYEKCGGRGVWSECSPPG
jgi:hypothetical protein